MRTRLSVRAVQDLPEQRASALHLSMILQVRRSAGATCFVGIVHSLWSKVSRFGLSCGMEGNARTLVVMLISIAPISV